ncbi:MAG: hypothetical protein ACR2IV_14345, partial [Bryobacteraceae bacterium]
PRSVAEDTRKMQNIGMAAVRRKFSPEFVNRIDSVITYKPLGRAAYELILDQIFANFADLIRNRLGVRGFRLQCTAFSGEGAPLGYDPSVSAIRRRGFVLAHKDTRRTNTLLSRLRTPISAQTCKVFGVAHGPIPRSLI